jgi:hypothetical protein
MNPIDIPYIPIIIILLANDTDFAATVAVCPVEFTLGPFLVNNGTKGTVIPSNRANIQIKCQEKSTLIFKYRSCINLLSPCWASRTRSASRSWRQRNLRSAFVPTGVRTVDRQRTYRRFGEGLPARWLNEPTSSPTLRRRYSSNSPHSAAGTATCRRKRLLGSRNVKG